MIEYINGDLSDVPSTLDGLEEGELAKRRRSRAARRRAKARARARRKARAKARRKKRRARARARRKKRKKIFAKIGKALKKISPLKIAKIIAKSGLKIAKIALPIVATVFPAVNVIAAPLNKLNKIMKFTKKVKKIINEEPSPKKRKIKKKIAINKIIKSSLPQFTKKAMIKAIVSPKPIKIMSIKSAAKIAVKKTMRLEKIKEEEREEEREEKKPKKEKKYVLVSKKRLSGAPETIGGFYSWMKRKLTKEPTTPGEADLKSKLKIERDKLYQDLKKYKKNLKTIYKKIKKYVKNKTIRNSFLSRYYSLKKTRAAIVYELKHYSTLKEATPLITMNTKGGIILLSNYRDRTHNAHKGMIVLNKDIDDYMAGRITAKDLPLPRETLPRERRKLKYGEKSEKYYRKPRPGLFRIGLTTFLPALIGTGLLMFFMKKRKSKK